MTEKTDQKDEVIERMFGAGAHFGYSKSRRHPSTASYIFGTKNRAEIFDLEKTKRLLLGAKEYMKKLGAEGKTVLFVGGKSEARDVIKKSAEALSMPYVAGRWIGGTLTNFSEIKKRIDRLVELQESREKGELAKKYTKKELLMIDRDINRLEENFAGLVPMKELPNALLVVDTRQEEIAVTEAGKKHIPVIGLANSDCDVSDITYPIVANDATMASITFFVSELIGSYEEGVKIRGSSPEKESTVEKKDN